jgi:choline kinase
MEVGQGPNWGCSANEKKILEVAVVSVVLIVAVETVVVAYHSEDVVSEVVLDAALTSRFLYNLLPD